MPRAPKILCLFCENRMTPGLSFCPTCARPTSWATHDERVAWEVEQWRHDRGEAKEAPIPEPVVPNRVFAAAASAASMSELSFEAPARPVRRLIRPAKTRQAAARAPSRPEPPAPARTPAPAAPARQPAASAVATVGVKEPATPGDDPLVEDFRAMRRMLERSLDLMETVNERVSALEGRRLRARKPRPRKEP